MKPSDKKASISVEMYDEKTAENDRNCYVAKKRMISKLSKMDWSQILGPNLRLD